MGLDIKIDEMSVVETGESKETQENLKRLICCLLYTIGFGIKRKLHKGLMTWYH